MADPRRLPPPREAPSLDEQIAMAERAVIARDLRIRRRANALVRHARHEAIKHAGGGLLLGVGTVALTWWLNHLSRRNAPPSPPPEARKEDEHATFEHLFRDAGVILAGLLPMLWPMLPRTWRRGVTPNTAGTVLTFLAPILGKLFRRKAREREAS
jgi:hypothetical protein